jgi:inorganic pyrophosphatase
VEITHTYGRDEAHEVIRRSHGDYLVHYSGLEQRLQEVLRS